ncbi:MetS family NSS transporter small subunit [Fulvivirga sp. M361]|uniref:MetS family NSS transporter small subunit n=1 Tax=Fulvivirga sp. M361 TaxID=2594266 RepID=UPI00351AD0C3
MGGSIAGRDIHQPIPVQNICKENSMSLSSIFAMVFILGVVVGGFIFFLSQAIKKEREKE